jgi:hypothetical protein
MLWHMSGEGHQIGDTMPKGLSDSIFRIGFQIPMLSTLTDDTHTKQYGETKICLFCDFKY